MIESNRPESVAIARRSPGPHVLGAAASFPSKSPSGGSPVGGAGPGAGLVLHALRRWWKVTLPAGLLLATIGATASYLMFVPRYEAEALLQIEEQPQFIAFEPRNGEHSKTSFLTQMQLIQSAWILGRVVEQPEVAGLPEIRQQADRIGWLSKKVKVASLGESNAFKITYASDNPQHAAMVVNEVTRQYLKARSESEASRNKDIIRALAREMKSRQEAVAELRGQVRGLTQRMTGKDPFVTRTDPSLDTSHPLAELQAKLTAIQVDRVFLQAKLKALEEQTAGEPAHRKGPAPIEPPLSDQERAIVAARVERAVEDNPAIRQQAELLRTRRAYLNELQGLLARGKRDPAYLRAEAKVLRDETHLETQRKELRARLRNEEELGRVAQRMAAEGSTLGKYREELAQMRRLLRSYEIAEENLKNAYSSLLKELEKARGDNLDLLFKKEELSQSEKGLGPDYREAV